MGDTVSLSALFVSAFTSATLLPGTSDAVLGAVLWRNPALAWQALAVATLGNSLGGMLSYGLGRLLPEKIRHRFSEKTVQYCRRWGAPVLLLSWLPLLGDALPFSAGWLRLNWRQSLCFLILGKFLRYLVLMWITLAAAG